MQALLKELKKTITHRKKQREDWNDELGGKIMKWCVALRPKGCFDKKAKGTKDCGIKGEIKFQNFKKCLENDKKLLKSQQKFRSKAHSVFTEKVNKIALNANDSKKIQMLDEVTTYPSDYEF